MRCKVCGETDPTNFHRRLDGYQAKCKKCNSLAVCLYEHRKRFNFDVTLEELLFLFDNTKRCLYCGRIMEKGIGKNHDLSPTLDIIDPFKNRITAKDVHFICHQCNRTKSNRSHNEFVDFCQRVVKSFCTSTSSSSKNYI